MIVIGSGPGGQRAALQGAKAGKKIAIVEEYPAVGGGCVHYGTLPSKSFRESVYRWSMGSRNTLPDMEHFLRRRDRVVSNESQIIFDQLKRNGVTIFHGKACFTNVHEIEVNSSKGKEKLSADFIVIATGARPFSPKHIEVDGEQVFDSNNILTLKKLPRSMVVLGAGIIGCEYASMFSMAGTQVYLVDRRHEILAAVDREIVNHLVERFVHEGMEILLEVEKTEVHPRSKGQAELEVSLSSGRKINADTVLVTQGRYGNTDGLGLDRAGVARDERGLVAVDKYFRTSVPHIYAVGDVVGPPALASTSYEQGRIASCNAFGIEEATMAEFFPYGIYTIPEISMLGPTEEDLVAQKADFVVGRARYRELARGQIVGDRWGILKLLVDRRTLRLLGVHIIGDNAADLIHIGQAVMAFGGDANYFIRSVFNYPTLAEAYKTAAFHAVNQVRGLSK